jgi:hypothetical protein
VIITLSITVHITKSIIVPKTYSKLFSIKGCCFCCCCFQCNFPYLIVCIRAWFAGKVFEYSEIKKNTNLNIPPLVFSYLNTSEYSPTRQFQKTKSFKLNISVSADCFSNKVFLLYCVHFLFYVLHFLFYQFLKLS